MLFEKYLSIPLFDSWNGGMTWNIGGFDRQHLERLVDFLRDRLPQNPVLLESGAGDQDRPGPPLSMSPW
jgi:hypothetical protein